MWTVDRAALVFCIDQVEDLRFFDDAEERFQQAARDLIQIANRVTDLDRLISCLGDFYGQVRERSPNPISTASRRRARCAPGERARPEEARLIIAKRLRTGRRGTGCSDPAAYFGPQFFEEFGGLSTRRILELAQTRVREQAAASEPEPRRGEAGGFISTLAAALGFGGSRRESEPTTPAEIDFRELWERFTAQSEAEIPSDDQELLDVLAGALALAREEWGRAIELTVNATAQRGFARRRPHA